MNIKHIILGLAATVLLAGCGGNASSNSNSNSSSTSNGSSSSNSSSSTSESGPTEEELKKKHGITPVFDEENDTLTYGLYPQTHVSDTKTIAALDALTTKEKNGWYYYNYEYYVKSSASPCSEDYKFSDGTTIVNKTEYWFKCELITWNVLNNTGDGYTIYSNALLDVRRYDDGYNGYKDSEIRKWLNYDFYLTAFNLSGKCILDTTVDNSSSTTDTLNSDPNNYACDNTYDKIFTLCFKDYLNGEFGFPSDRNNASSARQAKPTDYALAKNCYQSNGYASYWTRSPSSAESTKAWYVQYDGKVADTSTVETSNFGVRPAFNIKL